MSSSGARWRRFELSVAKHDAAPAAALLETAARACSATELESACARVSVFVRREFAAVAAARIQRLLARARRLKALREFRLSDSTVADEDWAASWKRYYRPQRVAPRLFIVPSWIKSFRPPRGAQALRLDPGMAFGTGQHPSTQLALRLLLPHIRAEEVVLDLGCGSGILALAAAQRCARVYASDVDPIAVKATHANFAANDLQFASLKRARGVPAAFPKADLIVSNISARVVIHLAAALAAKLKPQGRLIIAGFTDRSRPEVREALRGVGLALTAERCTRPWLAQVYQRR